MGQFARGGSDYWRSNSQKKKKKPTRHMYVLQDMRAEESELRDYMPWG